MFNSNSIFDTTDKEEAKKAMFQSGHNTTKNDEEWISDNLSKLLDDEMDFKDHSSKKKHVSQGTSNLLHQFESVDNMANREPTSLLDQAFDRIDYNYQKVESQLNFPEPQNDFSSHHNLPKFQWKSNPCPPYAPAQYTHDFSTPNTAYNYYQPTYSPFDQFDHQQFAAQHSSPYNSPDNYNRVYNEPYYAHSQPDCLQFPEPDPTSMFNANHGSFSHMDSQDPFQSLGSGGGAECIQFPSNSNMVSTSGTSNNLNGFYRQGEYPNRISCPIKLQSKGKLEAKEAKGKYKSGDNKSSFMKALETKLEENAEDVVISDVLGKGKLEEVAKNQKGSRFIQEVYYAITEEEKDQLFEELKDWWKELMTDKFGNYVIQKIFEHGSEEHKIYLSQQLKGSVMSMSMDDHGCRVIQKILENLKSDAKNDLILELHGNVEKLIYNRNGNHVIQKCIEFVSEKNLAFIIEELSENIYAFCKHKYGCRVIGKLIEFWKSEEVDRIVDEILPNINELTFDASGNYVSQSILMHGKTAHKKEIIFLFKKDLIKYSTEKYASNVIECCFKYWSNAQRKEIVKELLKTPKGNTCSLERMLKDKYGNYVLQKMLEKLDEADRSTVINRILEITKKRKQLNNSAKHVLKIIKKFSI